MKKLETIQKIKLYPLEHLKSVWYDVVGDDWNESFEGGKMNKKNIINSLLIDCSFDEDFRDLFTDETGEYHGLSLGKHSTTEDSVLDYIEKYHPFYFL